jgi:hypothetical protein
MGFCAFWLSKSFFTFFERLGHLAPYTLWVFWPGFAFLQTPGRIFAAESCGDTACFSVDSKPSKSHENWQLRPLGGGRCCPANPGSSFFDGRRQKGRQDETKQDAVAQEALKFLKQSSVSGVVFNFV